MNPWEESPHEIAEEIDRREKLELMLATLTPRERKVICLRFALFGNEFHTLRQTGAILERSWERVRQIQNKALRKLVHKSRTKIVKEYFNQKCASFSDLGRIQGD